MSRAEGASVEAPQAPRGVEFGEGSGLGRGKPAKSADVRANAKCLLYSTKKTTFRRFMSFIKVTVVDNR